MPTYAPFGCFGVRWVNQKLYAFLSILEYNNLELTLYESNHIKIGSVV